MHRHTLLKLLANYHTRDIHEKAMVEHTRRFVLEHENCFDRSLSEGHVTGTAWVLNPSRSHALMLHHRKLNMWLQPGGHADGDTDITRVALTEASEESGIDPSHIKLLSPEIFDVDVHTVYPSEHDTRHQHFDIRFLLEIDDSVAIPGNDESHQIGWVPLRQVTSLNNARSLYRMVQKSRRLNTCVQS